MSFHSRQNRARRRRVIALYRSVLTGVGPRPIPHECIAAIHPPDVEDDEPVGQILTRRETLALLGAGGIALLGQSSATAAAILGSDPAPGPSSRSAAAAARTSLHIVATPAVTEGPFFVDEKLNRPDITAGSTRPDVAAGIPLELQFLVYKLDGRKASPLVGAHLDVWHASINGVYSDESKAPQWEDTRGLKFLRGYQVTDSSGAVRFKTIYPGWYGGRTPHIHFKIRLYGPGGQTAYEFTSQVFMSEAINNAVFSRQPYSARGQRRVYNQDDSVYNTPEWDGSIAGPSLLIPLTASGNGYAGTFRVGLQMG